MVPSALMAPPRRPARAPRAPRRAGARTTLRVPDALVRLALDGAKRYRYELEVAELARVRGEAIMRLPKAPPDAEMPSGDEIAEAILAWRLGLVDEEEFGA